MKGYGFCLNEWLFDENIKNELSLLIYISSLTAERGYAFASNEYFSEKFKTTPETISRKIKKLEKCGYIKIKYKMRGAEILKREIRLTQISSLDGQKNQSYDGQEYQPTIDENVKDNITSINNNIYSEEYILESEHENFEQKENSSYKNFEEIEIFETGENKKIKNEQKEKSSAKKEKVVVAQKFLKNNSLEYLEKISQKIEQGESPEKPEWVTSEQLPEWNKFILYWTEPDKNGKIRAKTQKTFEIRRRWITWIARSSEFNKNNFTSKNQNSASVW